MRNGSYLHADDCRWRGFAREHDLEVAEAGFDAQVLGS
jgi:hypothetical protein